MTAADMKTARQEFSSLLDFARITYSGARPVTTILREMIEVPPRERAAIEAFCDRNPTDAIAFEHALEIRDYMLELLEVRCGQRAN